MKASRSRRSSIKSGFFVGALAALLAVTSICSCTSRYQSPLLDDPYALPEIADPREESNRATMQSALEGNRSALGKASKGYKKVPSYFRDRVRDFSGHMREPERFVASLLQGKIEKAFRSLMRFVFNSIFGLFGLIDIASTAGTPPANEDMGQVLASWGWREGIYLVTPWGTPTTSRDFFGGMLGALLRPTWITGFALGGPYLSLTVDKPALDFLEYLDNADIVTKLEEGSVDPYASFKSFYLNRRHRLITDEIE